MTEGQENANTAKNEQVQNGESQNNWTPPANQAELDRIIESRLSRERTKYSDYEEYKAKAKKLEEIETANQSDLERANGALEKATNRIKELEGEISNLSTTQLRLSVANEFGISPEDRELFLTATDEETLRRQATRLAEQNNPVKEMGSRKPAPIPGQGTIQQKKASTKDQFAAAVQGLF